MKLVLKMVPIFLCKHKFSQMFVLKINLPLHLLQLVLDLNWIFTKFLAQLLLFWVLSVSRGFIVYFEMCIRPSTPQKIKNKEKVTTLQKHWSKYFISTSLGIWEGCVIIPGKKDDVARAFTETWEAPSSEIICIYLCLSLYLCKYVLVFLSICMYFEMVTGYGGKAV